MPSIYVATCVKETTLLYVCNCVKEIVKPQMNVCNGSQQRGNETKYTL